MARKSRGCAEAYMGTASRSVEILPAPPPEAVANSAGGPTAAKAEKDPSRMETILFVSQFARFLNTAGQVKKSNSINSQASKP
jgi:hypothetical protein